MRITDIKWIAGVLYRKRKKPDRRPNINNKWVAGVLMAAAFCILLSCEREQQNNRPPATSEESVTSSVESVSLSAWVVDWQLAAGIDDYDVLASRLNHLQLFALYFNEEPFL